MHFDLTSENKLFLIKLKPQNIGIDLQCPLCPKEKQTLKETSRETEIVVVAKKINLKWFLYNIKHKSNYIFLLWRFFVLEFWNNLGTFFKKIVWNFQHLSGISDKDIYTLILLPYGNQSN